jgi:hypothetical protein
MKNIERVRLWAANSRGQLKIEPSDGGWFVVASRKPEATIMFEIAESGPDIETVAGTLITKLELIGETVPTQR